MKAKLIRKDKKIFGDRIREMVLWHVPVFNKGSNHTIKYRLYYGDQKGNCIVRYDNEAGKGDHIHYGEQEKQYSFIGIEQLIIDFFNDIQRLDPVYGKEMGEIGETNE